MASTKGQKTKDIILRSSRNLFYEYGYTNTTLRMIAEKSNCNLGLFQYHFNGKRDIARHIYSDIRNTFEELLLEHEPDISEQDMFFLSSSMELYLCWRNDNFARFFGEYLSETTYDDRRFQYILSFYQTYGSKDDNHNTAAFDAVCVTAIKPALVNYALSVKDTIQLDELARFYLRQQLHYLNLDENLADSYLALLNKYHIDLAVNFTPVFTRLLPD